MFCPRCSESKASEETVYCTRCGLDLSDLDSFVDETVKARSNTGRGIKQGIILLALGLLLIPVWMFIGAAFPPADKLVESSPSTTWPEQIAWIVMWMAFIGSALRIAYSLVFERSETRRHGQSISSLNKSEDRYLASAEAFEAAQPGKWRTTDDLAQTIIRKTRTSGEL
jgi:hypothetical protein